jgi:hypothetical protein
MHVGDPQACPSVGWSLPKPFHSENHSSKYGLRLFPQNNDAYQWRVQLGAQPGTTSVRFVHNTLTRINTNMYFVSGGSFSSPKAFSAQLLQNAAKRDNLIPTSPEIDSVPAVGLEFANGAIVLGSSNVGCQVQFLNDAF